MYPLGSGNGVDSPPYSPFGRASKVAYCEVPGGTSERHPKINASKLPALLVTLQMHALRSMHFGSRVILALSVSNESLLRWPFHGGFPRSHSTEKEPCNCSALLLCVASRFSPLSAERFTDNKRGALTPRNYTKLYHSESNSIVLQV